MAQVNVNQLPGMIMSWLKKAIGLCLLAIIAVTAIEMLGFNVPGISGIPLTQNAGIGMAGLGFLYSKL